MSKLSAFLFLLSLAAVNAVGEAAYNIKVTNADTPYMRSRLEALVSEFECDEAKGVAVCVVGSTQMREVVRKGY